MLFPLHPKVVHFPIALYLTGTLAILLYLWQKDPFWERGAFTLLFMGWLGNIVAAVTGLMDSGQLSPQDPRWATLNQHITAGIAMWVVFGLVLYLRLRWRRVLDDPMRRWAVLGLAVAGVLIVVLDGFIGGRLVYGLRVGIE